MTTTTTEPETQRPRRGMVATMSKSLGVLIVAAALVGVAGGTADASGRPSPPAVARAQSTACVHIVEKHLVVGHRVFMGKHQRLIATEHVCEPSGQLRGQVFKIWR